MSVALLILAFVVVCVIAWCARLDSMLSRLLERERLRDEAEAERLRRQGL